MTGAALALVSAGLLLALSGQEAAQQAPAQKYGPPSFQQRSELSKAIEPEPTCRMPVVRGDGLMDRRFVFGPNTGDQLPRMPIVRPSSPYGASANSGVDVGQTLLQNRNSGISSGPGSQKGPHNETAGFHRTVKGEFGLPELPPLLALERVAVEGGVAPRVPGFVQHRDEFPAFITQGRECALKGAIQRPLRLKLATCPLVAP
jgi:hypothetical protein